MHLDFMLALLIYYAHPLSVPNGFDAPQLGYQMEPLDKPAKLRVRITVAAEVATRVACSCLPSVVASPCCYPLVVAVAVAIVVAAAISWHFN